MGQFTLFLFPHTWIAAKDLEGILLHFGRLTLCQAWYMNPPLWQRKIDAPSPIHIFYPRDALKPKNHFDQLLSEYRLWMRENQHQGYRAFLKAFHDRFDTEDQKWEIRKMIRQMGKSSSGSPENQTLKWHLILHLARELEESRTEANEILTRIKLQKPPLAEAIGENLNGRNLFEDLPTAYQPFMSRDHVRQVLEAWFGLFGEYLENDGILITLDLSVFDFAAEIFEDEVTVLMREEERFDPSEIAPNRSDMKLRQLPKISSGAREKKDLVLVGLSGKTLVYFGKP